MAAARSHWLVKTEPECFSIQDLAASPKQTTSWSGVRNYQARNFMRAMNVGDPVLFYHSSASPPAVAGTAVVARAAYPDPTAPDPQWVAVDLKPVKVLATPVPLAAIRYDKRLSGLPLIRQSQLSVMPLTKDEFDVLVGLGSGPKKKR